MRGLSAEDIAVVIPTRDRWGVLARTLDSLQRQSISGFTTVVVVDGDDQRPPDLGDARIEIKAHRGPGAARNWGVRATSQALVLFLGDDMVPAANLVEAHLKAHIRHSSSDAAVLGRAKWHPEVASGAIERWLEWSHTQFNYDSIQDAHAGFGRFYSCNVSLKRDLFERVGGFDEDFTYYYEDLDLGWRLHEQGMTLFYEPEALCYHLHRYDMPSLQRRFFGMGMGEHMMASKHPWFQPYFLDRVAGARQAKRRMAGWSYAVELAPQSDTQVAKLIRRKLRENADIFYYQALARSFLDGWHAWADLEELRCYLGDSYDPRQLMGHQRAVEQELSKAGSEVDFYRSSEAYLYDLTAFSMSGTKSPYLEDLRALVQPGSAVLDYGCGIGADGLRLAELGYAVSFADYNNPSTRYLRWRVGQRGLDLPIYDIEADEIPSGFDAVYAFDVIEHVDNPFKFLGHLESLADLVIVNLLEPDEGDTHLHKSLPIKSLLDHAERCGLVRYRRYHKRSHLVAYRSPAKSHLAASARLASSLTRHLGPAAFNLQSRIF